ncbi:hypothetical protein SH668x_002676 [Planctomicrobium sp. SH668]|uniref:hypothetical protein n=1 Tax=Planctomicrobium sp. SH668 TaxID=3448126 RepID=UPI003F5B6CB7
MKGRFENLVLIGSIGVIVLLVVTSTWLMTDFRSVQNSEIAIRGTVQNVPSGCLPQSMRVRIQDVRIESAAEGTLQENGTFALNVPVMAYNNRTLLKKSVMTHPAEIRVQVEDCEGVVRFDRRLLQLVTSKILGQSEFEEGVEIKIELDDVQGIRSN